MRSIVLSWLSFSLVLFLPSIQAQANYTFQELKKCSLNTTQLAGLGEGDVLEPCIIFDEKNENINSSATVTFVQVTPADCGNHRDGAVIGVQSLNKDNDGKGLAALLDGDRRGPVRRLGPIHFPEVFAGLGFDAGGEGLRIALDLRDQYAVNQQQR